VPKPLKLTPREQAVLDAICELGQTDLVARKLDISPRTVEIYISRAMATNKYPNRLMLALTRDRELRSKRS
jgi:DNA-binding CsgD family transcriptional regulator